MSMTWLERRKWLTWLKSRKLDSGLSKFSSHDSHILWQTQSLACSAETGFRCILVGMRECTSADGRIHGAQHNTIVKKSWSMADEELKTVCTAYVMHISHVQAYRAVSLQQCIEIVCLVGKGALSAHTHGDDVHITPIRGLCWAVLHVLGIYHSAKLVN